MSSSDQDSDDVELVYEEVTEFVDEVVSDPEEVGEEVEYLYVDAADASVIPPDDLPEDLKEHHDSQGWKHAKMPASGKSLVTIPSPKKARPEPEPKEEAVPAKKKKAPTGPVGCFGNAIPLPVWIICMPCNILQFCWVCPLVVKAFKKAPTMDDIPPVCKSGEQAQLGARFDKVWPKLKKAKCCGLFLSVVYVSLFMFLSAGLLQVFATAGTIMTPKVMEQFLKCLRPELPPELSSLMKWYEQILPENLQPTPEVLSNSFRDPEVHPNYEAWCWLIALVSLAYFGVVLLHNSFYLVLQVGMRAGTLLTSVMFKKALRLSAKSKSMYPPGKILSLANKDTFSIMGAFMLFFYGMLAIPTIGVCVYFLVDLMGYAAGIASSVYVVAIPGILFLWWIMIEFKASAAKHTDTRVTRITELLAGIRVTKFFGWEAPYLKRVGEARKKEVCRYHGVAFIYSAVFALMNSSNIVGQMIACATLWFFEKTMDPVMLFTSIAYFGLLVMPLTLLPIAVVSMIDNGVAMNRIFKFLNAEELDDIDTSGEIAPGVAISIADGNFIWEAVEKKDKGDKKKCSCKKPKKDEKEEHELKDIAKIKATPGKPIDPWSLKDINVEIPKGKLTMVIGKVGSGKSSLLQAILGEMKRVTGDISVAGKFAYCCQVPWIQNASLKNNILFGKEEDEDLLDEVVKVSQLTADLAVLQGGIDISIGERGINLSGGQKYRVSLARACYRRDDADIFLLDDPLGAVDAHVGRALLEGCICDFLAGKTRIVVTHQLQHVRAADYLILVDDGRILERGPTEKLLAAKTRTAELVSQHLDKSEKKEEAAVVVSIPESIDPVKVKHPAVDPKKAKEEEEDKKKEKPKDIMQKEKKGRGCVGCKLVIRYAYAFGCKGLPCLPIVLVALIAQAFLTCNVWFLGEWSKGTYAEIHGTEFNTTYYIPISQVNAKNPSAVYLPSGHCPPDSVGVCVNEMVDILWTHHNNDTRLVEGLTPIHHAIIYTVLGLLGVILSLIRDLMVMHCGVNASKRLHEKALRGVTHSPMSWFDTTPLGRIISRLTVDVMLMDWMLPVTLMIFIGMMLNVVSTLILVGVVTYGIFIGAFVPFAIVYVVIYILYRSFAVETKRLAHVSRSPVSAHFSESIVGSSTIRAYGREKQFSKVQNGHLDYSNAAFHITMAGRSWIGTTLGLTSAIVLFTVGVIVICFAYYFPEDMNIGLAFLSLAVSRTVTATGLFERAVEYATNTEATFTSVERLDEFAESLETEEMLHKKRLKEKGMKEVKPPDTWPIAPRVTFDKYSMRYREGLPEVLKEISFSVAPGEKIGIVGRTGSGKSSLMLALYRIVEGSGGRIIVGGTDDPREEGASDPDAIDHSLVSIAHLRSRLSMIPQDPVLFAGTIRTNLDPFKLSDDAAIWNALQAADMNEKIEGLKGKLDADVQEGGANFSVGQKQLLCLARALLRKTRILLLDEVTASVDLETDQAIQKTVRRAFAKCTVITIAHRLRTIIDSDRIFVLDDGGLAEEGTPRDLLKTRDGPFAKLVAEDGPEAEAVLRAIVSGEKKVYDADVLLMGKKPKGDQPVDESVKMDVDVGVEEEEGGEEEIEEVEQDDAVEVVEQADLRGLSDF